MDFDIQKNKGIIVSIIILLIISGITVTWIVNKDNSTIKRDGKVLARMRWHVEAERTWSQIKYSYQRDSCIKKGGTVTASDRCYYPADYYEILKRSLLNTVLYKDNITVLRNTPYYKYGTRGAYAGILTEESLFENVDDIEKFPESYITKWDPKDTRNYKLVFRVWDLKEQPLSDGNYTLCQYGSRNIKIDLKDECQELDHAEVKGDRIWFYFKNLRGEQSKDIILVDPISSPLGTYELEIYLNDLNDSRKYELGEIVEINVTSNCSTLVECQELCLDIDYFGYGINYSCNSEFLINITNFNNQDSPFNVTFDLNENKTEFLSIFTNVNLVELIFTFSGFSGELAREYDNFDDNSINTSRWNITQKDSNSKVTEEKGTMNLSLTANPQFVMVIYNFTKSYNFSFDVVDATDPNSDELRIIGFMNTSNMSNSESETTYGNYAHCRLTTATDIFNSGDKFEFLYNSSGMYWKKNGTDWDTSLVSCNSPDSSKVLESYPFFRLTNNVPTATDNMLVFDNLSVQTLDIKYMEIGDQDGIADWTIDKFNGNVNISRIEEIINEGCNCTNCTIIGTNCTLPIYFSSEIEGFIQLEISIGATYIPMSVNYNQTTVSDQEFSDGTRTKIFNETKEFNISITDTDDLEGFEFQIDGTCDGASCPENITIELIDGSTRAEYPSILNGTVMYIYTFTNGLQEENVTYLSAGTVTRQINYTLNHIANSKPENITLQFWGFDEDPNEFDFTEKFFNETYILSKTSDISYIWDDFSTGEISGHWADDGSGHTVVQDQYVTDSQTASAGAGGGSCCDDHHYTNAGSFYSDSFDISEYNEVTMRVVLTTSGQSYGVGCACTPSCSSSAGIGIKDKTTGVFTGFGVSSGGSGYDKTITIRKEGNYLKWFENGVYDSQLAIDLTHQYEVQVTLNPDTNVAGNIYIILTCGATGFIYPLNISGFVPQYLGSRQFNTTGLFLLDTVLLNNFTSNVTRARITTTKRNSGNGGETLYLSNDNVTWEEASSGSFHVFTSVGNQLFARLNITSTDADEPYLIEEYTVDVGMGSIDNLKVDIGNDGAYEWNMTGVLNSTNSPQNATIEKDDVFESIQDNCIDSTTGDALGDTCPDPIVFQSDSAGQLQFKLTEAKQRINTTLLNESSIKNWMEDNCVAGKCNVTFKINYTGGGNITIRDINVKFKGSKTVNITAHIGTEQFLRQVFWRYSKFNYSLPYTWTDDILWPITKMNQKNAQPYLQTVTIPIYNITGQAKDDPMIIGVSLSETNYCVDITASNTSIKGEGIKIKKTGMNLTIIPKNGSLGVWLWADLNWTGGWVSKRLLEGYWKLNGNDTDASENNRDSDTQGDPQTVTGQVNRAFEFDGEDDYINFTPINISTGLTYMAWIKKNETGINEILRNYNSLLRVTDDQLSLWTNVSAESCTTNYSLSNNKFYHVAATWNLTNCLIYLNGSMIYNTSYTETFDTEESKSYIARYNTTYFNGTIDEVRIYSKYLTGTEINEIYNNSVKGCEDPPRYFDPDITFESCCDSCTSCW